MRKTNIAGIVACACLLAMAALAALAQEEGSQKFPAVKCEELKKMIDSKAADILVVSNDPQESYKEGHIPGAVSLPWVDNLKPPISLPRSNKTLILYCSCSHEEDSTDMASKLTRFGYRNIKVLEGGFIRWTQLKYPIETK
jgi:3-mercaptopyruvate sulfurtransferase SseA